MITGQEFKMTYLWLLVLCACSMAQDVSDGIINVDDRSYLLMEKPATWMDSLKICRESGAHLAVISSLADAEDIKSIMAEHNIDFIHSGFHDSFTEGDYVTLFGETMLTSKESPSWDPLHPQGSDKNNCGGFSQQGFSDVECSELRPFICSFNRRPAVQHKALPGYDLMPGLGYYKLYNGSNWTWTEAEAICRTDGAHLVIFNSQEERDALREGYFPNSDYFYTWVGVHRIFGGDDDFVTVLGGPLNETWYNWYPGQPYGNYTDRPYVYYRLVMRTSGLLTTPPEETWNFICEEELI